MKNFSQLITEPNKYIKSDTNEFAGVLLAGALLAYACAPLVSAAGDGLKKYWGFLYEKGKKNMDNKSDDDKSTKSNNKSDEQYKNTFNSLLILARQSNEKEKNANEKKKNDSLLKLLIACSFDKDGNEIPLEERIDKMKDTMSSDQFESFKKDMIKTYEKNKDNQDFKDALVKAKSNIKSEEYDKMIDDAKKEAKTTLEQLNKEKKEIEDYNKKLQDLDDEINGGDEKDKEIRELKKQLEELKNNPPTTITGDATGISPVGTSEGDKKEGSEEEGDKKEGSEEDLKNYSNEDIEKMQDELSDLDPEKDKDKIKEKEELLKSIAKANGKSEDEFLPKEEKGADGKSYQHKTGPRGGKYYRVKGDDGWGPWNSGKPGGTNESLMSYLIRLLN